MENLEIWNKVKQVPPARLRQITGGRLKGKTDISPQWRYEALTELFGPCGIGWKFTIDKQWSEDGINEKFAFVNISLYIKQDGQWSEAIPGSGGSLLVEKESSGPHNNDEGYKMALTDALSVACKMLGVAADIYLGLWDGSKYKEEAKHKADPSAERDAAKAGGFADPVLADMDYKALRVYVASVGKSDSISEEQKDILRLAMTESKALEEDGNSSAAKQTVLLAAHKAAIMLARLELDKLLIGKPGSMLAVWMDNFQKTGNDSVKAQAVVDELRKLVESLV